MYGTIKVKVLLVRSALTFLLCAPGLASSAEECAAISLTEFGGARPTRSEAIRRPEIHLTQSGDHCLEQDVHQGKLWDRRTGRESTAPGGDAVILIGADDVRVDLRGYTVSNDRLLGYTLVKHYHYVPGRAHLHWFARTQIRNGSLVSPGSKGIAVRLIASGMYGPDGFGTVATKPIGVSTNAFFKDTSHLIESVTIRAGKRAILIDGRNNVIRNNRITVDGTTAIVAQGPGVVIENNVIEVGNNPDTLSESDRQLEAQTPFVIRLIQADGAIIRNNQIRLIDRPRQGSLPAAIDLVETTGALVEGNILGGMDTPVRADGSSTFQVVRNTTEACPGGATRYLPPGESMQAAGGQPLPPCR